MNNDKDMYWILRPSKKLPGRYYYFNTQTGEALWSMNDLEFLGKGNIKKPPNNVHKTPDKSNSNSRSDTPSIDNNEPFEPRSFNINQPLKQTGFAQPIFIMPQLAFNQAVFPNYMTNVEACIPNIVWMPIQCPSPIILPSNDKVPTMNQKTQTPKIQALKTQTPVQTCNIPSNKCFVNYDDCNYNNKVINQDLPDENPITSSELKKDNKLQNENLGIPNSKTTVKNPLLQTDCNIPEVNSIKNTTLDTGDNVDSPKTIENSDKGNEENLHRNLKENDLRHLLLAKKRKTTDIDETKGTVDAKKTKNSDSETSNKTVSFDLNNLLEDANDGDNIHVPNECAPIKKQGELKVTENILPKDHARYLVIDTDVYLADYEFIEQLVLTDTKCKLLIPQAVRSDIEALASGECQGQHRVIVARQLARRLATPAPHYTVEVSSSTTGNLNIVDSIINCCTQAMIEGHAVTLLSDNAQLHIKAKSHDIPCYKLQEFKTANFSTEPEIYSEYKNIKITINNDTSERNTNESHNFSIDKSEFLVDTHKEHMFAKNDENNIKEGENLMTHCEKQTMDFMTDRIRCLRNSNENFKTSTSTKIMMNSNVMKIRKTITNSNYDENNNIDSANCNNLFALQNRAQICNSQTDQPNEIDGILEQDSQKQVRSLDNTTKSVFFNDKTKDPDSKTCSSFQMQANKNPVQLKINMNENSVIIKNNTNILRVINEPNIIKNINAYLNEFTFLDIDIKEKITRRMDEWFCIYTQIMEDALVDLYQNTDIVKPGAPVQWALYEAISGIKLLYENHIVIKTITDKFIELLDYIIEKFSISLVKNVDERYSNSKMKPEYFMKILGCGLLLIQHLKNIIPDKLQLNDAEKSLNVLLQNINNYSENDTVFLETPIIHSEVEEEKCVTGRLYKKGRSYVIDYLKKHYEAWNNVRTTQSKKVIRTFGKNLDMLKIDKNKSISLLKTTKDNKVNNNEPKGIKSSQNILPIDNPVKKDTEIAAPILDKTLENNSVNKTFNDHDAQLLTVQITNECNQNDELKVTRPIANITSKDDYTNIDQIPFTVHGNTFIRQTENTDPKVIRNIKMIDAVEEKLRSKENLLDHSNIQTPLFEISDKLFRDDLVELSCDSDISLKVDKKITKDNILHDNIINSHIDKMTINGKILNLLKENKIKNNINFIKSKGKALFNVKNKYISVNDKSINYTDIMDISLNDNATNDSGFENESTYAHTLVKVFLTELSGSLKITHKFIDQFVKLPKGSELCDEKKKALNAKATECIEIIGLIMRNLRSIIQRESAECTKLKTLLLNAGVEASNDKRITRYRQVVIKCLEQTQILFSGLKIMASLTGSMEHLSSSSDCVDSNIKYFNIFE